jgi:hypothetical protein
MMIGPRGVTRGVGAPGIIIMPAAAVGAAAAIGFALGNIALLDIPIGVVELTKLLKAIE